jgi:2',3'-cyclic-nucleotide 2'-phosphodiesterase (5'-nucleotidase family)
MYWLLALLLAGAAPFPVPPSRASDTARTQDGILLRVLAINDLHGALEPQTWPWSGGRAVGGAPALKAWFDTLSRACHCTTVRLDGGDEMQGTLLSNVGYGRAAVAALNAFGIDAAAIGNHEFDWSVDTLRARMAEAHYRFLAANITDATGRARPDWAEPWTLIERGGQKIAVIGLALRATPTNTAPRNVAGLAFGDGAAAVKRVLPQARAAASFVIVVAHEGAFCDGGGDAAAQPLAATACHGEILDVARRLDSGSVDLIVSGHTHSLVNTVVNGIPVVQARSSGAGIAVVDFVRGPGGRREVLARIETPYADRVSPDPELQSLIALFKVGIENITGRAITRIQADLRRQGDEYGLGRLIADAMRNVAKADVAIVNNGGIRADLAAGTATYGDLYQVMPFQNRVLRLTVKGDVLRQALEHAVAGGRPDGHVSGVELWYDPKQRPGRRIGKATLADGKGIDGGRSYTLAVSDFLATGGSGYTMLVGSPAADLGVIDLDAFIQYLSVLRQPIAAPDDARLHRKGGGAGGG